MPSKLSLHPVISCESAHCIQWFLAFLSTFSFTPTFLCEKRNRAKLAIRYMYTNTYVHIYTWVLKMEDLKIKPAPPGCSPRTGVMDGDAGSCVSIALSRVLTLSA